MGEFSRLTTVPLHFSVTFEKDPLIDLNYILLIFILFPWISPRNERHLNYIYFLKVCLVSVFLCIQIHVLCIVMLQDCQFIS